MLDSLSRQNMQSYLYEDLYNLEEVHWWHKAKRELVNFFLQRNLSDKESKILDVGCGTGKNIESFSKFGTVWGIDSSSEAISFCKKRGLKNVVRGNIEKIPFFKQSFNFVTALDVLEHVDDQKALKEIHRVLKKRGFLIATVPAFPKLWSRWDEVLHHKRRYTKNTLGKLLKNNGFKIIKISYMHSFLILPTLIIRAFKNLVYKDYYPSDFQLSNEVINSLLGKIAQIEKCFIISLSVPFGTSLIVVAQKYEKN